MKKKVNKDQISVEGKWIDDWDFADILEKKHGWSNDDVQYKFLELPLDDYDDGSGNIEIMNKFLKEFNLPYVAVDYGMHKDGDRFLWHLKSSS